MYQIKKRLIVLLTILAVLVTGLPSGKPASAQGNLSIIRDNEIEDTVRGWAAPLIRAAGLNPQDVNFIFVQSPVVNAFVAGGPNIFIHTGLIDKAETPDELLGVIAHELGHIAGGHLTRTYEVMDNLSFEMILGTILGGVAAIASGDARAVAAATAASGAMATNKFLYHSRVQESAADQAALSYLSSAQMSPQGLYSFFGKLADQELLPESQQSQYMRSHPITRERMDNIRNRMAQNKGAPMPESARAEYAVIKAKLQSFINPQLIEAVYPKSRNDSVARYARAIADYRQHRTPQALQAIETLIKEQPNNAYLYELKGQMLMESGQVSSALAPYRKAISLRPQAGLIRIAYAHALLETAGNDKAAINEALDQLRRAQSTEDRTPRMYRLMATGYGKLGDTGNASLYLAEEAVLQRRRNDARGHAQRAMTLLPKSSPGALKAQDIMVYLDQTQEQADKEEKERQRRNR